MYKRPLSFGGLIISKGHISHISDDVPKIKFIWRKFVELHMIIKL